jgi:hypothetical protein
MKTKKLLLLAILSATLIGCDEPDKIIVNKPIIIIVPGGDGNRDGDGGGTPSFSNDFAFIIEGKSASEINVFDAFWLELKPTNPVSGGRFRVWFHYAPSGDIWNSPHRNIVPYWGRGRSEILYAQYEDSRGVPLSPKKGITIHYK